MRTVHNSGRPDRVIVLSRNSQFEALSSISRDDALAIADAPGVKRTTDGLPVGSAEALSSILVTKKSNGLDFYVVIRGVGPEGFVLRPEIRLVNGRMFRPATHELIVGKSAQSEFEGLDVGSKVSLPEGDWTVTGTFESGGSGTESEILAHSATVLSAMRANAFKSMTVMLDRPDGFIRLKSALGSNPKLSIDILHETDYLASQSKQLYGFLTVVAYLVGGIMGLGALFGALNTLYAAVSTRSVEIATLRVFGFGAAAILTSVLAEALALSLLSAAIGASAAWFAFNGDLHAAGSLVFRLVPGASRRARSRRGCIAGQLRPKARIPEIRRVESNSLHDLCPIRLRRVFVRRSLLPLQFRLKCGFTLRHRDLIALWIHPHVSNSAGLQLFQFSKHVEVRAVCAQKDVTGQTLQDREGPLVVLRNPRIRRQLSGSVHQSEAGVYIPAPDDNDVKGFAVVLLAQCPRRASPRMSRGFVRDENRTPEPHFVPVVKDPVDFRRRIPTSRSPDRRTVGKILSAAALDHGHITIHHHVLGMGQAQHLGAAGVVVEVRVAYQQDLDIGESETELLDAAADQRNRRFEARVDQDIAPWGNNKIGREVLTSHVVEIPRNPIGINGCCPGGVRLGVQLHG